MQCQCTPAILEAERAELAVERGNREVVIAWDGAINTGSVPICDHPGAGEQLVDRMVATTHIIYCRLEEPDQPTVGEVLEPRDLSAVEILVVVARRDYNRNVLRDDLQGTFGSPEDG